MKRMAPVQVRRSGVCGKKGWRVREEEERVGEGGAEVGGVDDGEAEGEEIGEDAMVVESCNRCVFDR